MVLHRKILGLDIKIVIYKHYTANLRFFFIIGNVFLNNIRVQSIKAGSDLYLWAERFLLFRACDLIF